MSAVGEVGLTLNMDARCTPEGREEAKGQRKSFMSVFFPSCLMMSIFILSTSIRLCHFCASSALTVKAKAPSLSASATSAGSSPIFPASAQPLRPLLGAPRLCLRAFAFAVPSARSPLLPETHVTHLVQVFVRKSHSLLTSLVVQWMTVHLPMQGT